jgi:hypothetical protein
MGDVSIIRGIPYFIAFSQRYFPYKRIDRDASRAIYDHVERHGA